MRTSPWQSRLLQTPTTSHSWHGVAWVPWVYLTAGLRYQGPALALRAGTLCLTHCCRRWGLGGNTSILDKVCFSGSNLLISFWVLMIHHTVKTFFGPRCCKSVSHWFFSHLLRLDGGFNLCFYHDGDERVPNVIIRSTRSYQRKLLIQFPHNNILKLVSVTASSSTGDYTRSLIILRITLSCLI